VKVLVVHNRYSSFVPSGENVSVDSEVRWLQEAGVDVEVVAESNDDLVAGGIGPKLRMAAESAWSPSALRRVRDAIAAHRPDLVHVHNLFPRLTASACQAALDQELPVVWTVRNHRVVCVDGTSFRAGRPCHDCRPGWRVPGVVHGCYRGSPAASGFVTVATSIFRRMARRHPVTAVAISRSVRDWLVDAAGFDAQRVRLKHNGVAVPTGVDDAPPPAASRRFLFAGKLAEYKGVHLLLDAWRRTGDLDAELVVVGDGPLADVVAAAAAADPRITWAGQVPPEEVPDQLLAARAVVVPSVWDEPFGRSAAEALAAGRPVVTTGTGGLSEVVDDSCGWLTGTDPDALAAALVAAATSDDAVARRAEAARARHAGRFSPETTTGALVRIYEDAIAEAGRDPGR
jgi:glycosyltransferase involved in cell wall biosynthesis